MPCAEIHERLAEYLDDALPARRRRRIAAHLDGCADCRAELARLARVPELLANTAEPAPPDGLWPAVEARLGVARARRQPNWRYAVALAGAAAVAAVLLRPEPLEPATPYVRDHWRAASGGAMGDMLLVVATETAP